MGCPAGTKGRSGGGSPNNATARAQYSYCGSGRSVSYGGHWWNTCSSHRPRRNAQTGWRASSGGRIYESNVRDLWNRINAQMPTSGRSTMPGFPSGRQGIKSTFNTMATKVSVTGVGATISAGDVNRIVNKYNTMTANDCQCNSDCGANLACSCHGNCGCNY